MGDLDDHATAHEVDRRERVLHRVVNRRRLLRLFMASTRFLTEKVNPYCLQCRREVPLTPAIAVAVTKDDNFVGHLHRFHCQGEWQAGHSANYEYGLPKTCVDI